MPSKQEQEFWQRLSDEVESADAVQIATEEQEKQLRQFAQALEQLCAQYGVTLSGGDLTDCINVGFSDDQRPDQLKKDWPFFASFSGITPEGMFGGLDLDTYDLQEPSTREELVRMGRIVE